MSNTWRILATIGLSFFIGRCSTTPVGPELDFPLTSIYSAVEAEMTMGIQRYSENHRVCYSRPFAVNQMTNPKSKVKPKFRERGFAEITITGDTRPYSLEVEVRIERA